MKRFTAILMTVLLVVSCAACGKVSEKDRALVRDRTEGNTYTSSFAGFQFTPANSWEFSSEEDILALMDIDSGNKDNAEKLAGEIAKQKTIYESMATDIETGAYVLIMYENLSLTLGGNSYDEEKYAEALKSQLDESEYEYTYETAENVDLAGNTYYQLSASSAYSGVTVEQVYLIRKIDDYMLVICISNSPEVGASIEEIMGYFSAV